MIGRVALGVAVLTAHSAAAQTLSFVVADRAFGMSEGLPAAQVLSLYEDRSGAVWAGTTAGLARLGGAEVRVYGLEDGLPRNVIYAVAEARDGTLFVGTLGGIARFDGSTFRRELGPAGAERRVRSIVPGPQGELYALMGRDTILKLEGQAWEPLVLPDGLAPDGLALAVDKGGEPWLATRNLGLIHFASGARGALRVAGRYAEREGLPGGECDFVTRDGDGIAASGRTGILRVRGERVTRLPYPPGFEAGHAALTSAADGRLYLGGATGVARVDERAITVVRSSRSLAAAPVVRLMADRSGNVWMGTLDRGIHVLFTGTGVSYVRVDGQDLRGIECDADAFCWLSTARDLYRIPANAGEDARPVRVRTDGIEAGPTFSFEDDAEGNLLLALEDGVGVLPRDSRRGPAPVLRRDPRFERIGAAFVPRLLRDHTGNIWASSRTATWRLAPGARAAAEFTLGDRGSEPAAAIALDRADTLWISDHEGALWRVAPPERRAERVTLAGAPTGPIDQIATSPDGDALVSFENGGWALLGAGTGKLLARVNSSSELGRLSVLSLVRIAQGHYLAAHAGNRLSIVSLEPPRIEAPVLVSSDLDDADFRYLSARAAESGRYYLVTLGAVARLDGLRTLAAPPPLRIASLRTENEAADARPEHPRLGPRPNAVDVVLSLAEPVAPRQVRYRWRLKGESDRWSEWTSDPRVRISNLGAGDFVLEATAKDRYGRGALQSLALPISAAPLVWETWPFRAALLALSLALVYFVYRVRVSAVLRDRERLEAAVRERSAELAKANRELREASLTDPLTGLRNRRFFDAIIGDEEGRSRRAHSARPGETPPAKPDLVFYVVDLDHFKEINDSYGHPVGDRVLVEAARRILGVVRKADMVIRWGGEEFLVLSRDAHREEAEHLARRILSAVGASPFDLGDERLVRRTCSVGWSAFPWNPQAPDDAGYSETLRLADRALYESKSDGRNRATGFLRGEADEPRRVRTTGPSATAGA
jgi:diguanylate cyclase (GGDEF)-like protein